MIRYRNPKTKKWYDFDDSYVKEVYDAQSVVS